MSWLVCTWQCPLLALSGHRLVRCTCLLLTQSGHVSARHHDDHRASSLVIFFAVAATFVFFLPVADNFVDFLALLACCT